MCERVVAALAALLAASKNGAPKTARRRERQRELEARALEEQKREAAKAEELRKAEEQAAAIAKANEQEAAANAKRARDEEERVRRETEAATGADDE